MKVNYEKPKIEIIQFETEEILDIIDGSTGVGGDNLWPDD